MLAPPIPVDEIRRLATLHRLHILDTPPEERFDRLTRLAKHLFHVPTATITLVDADRQWFKSAVGLSAAETPRDVSFCGHAINMNSTMVVPDARIDPRFFDNPFVTGDPHIRFYAGCPLRMPDGSTIGTLCVIASQPREFGKNDRSLLSDLARMVEQEFTSPHGGDTDDLTGLPNRPAFKVLAQHAADRCRRGDLPASMISFKLDGLANINDERGYEEGDRALELFASVMRDTVNDNDVSGRIGGDEFAVLLYDSRETRTTAFVETIRRRLGELSQPATAGRDVFFDAGWVVVEKSGQYSVEELLVEADTRMEKSRRAKANTRLKIG